MPRRTAWTAMYRMCPPTPKTRAPASPPTIHGAVSPPRLSRRSANSPAAMTPRPAAPATALHRPMARRASSAIAARLSPAAATNRRPSRTRSCSSSSNRRTLRGSWIVYPISRSVPSSCSGRTSAGSYSTSACSWVRLTATRSTPGRRPSAFSIVPVHSEQWSPPIRARICFRPGRLEGSSLHRRSSVADDALMTRSLGAAAFVLAASSPYAFQRLERQAVARGSPPEHSPGVKTPGHGRQRRRAHPGRDPPAPRTRRARSRTPGLPARPARRAGARSCDSMPGCARSGDEPSVLEDVAESGPRGELLRGDLGRGALEASEIPGQHPQSADPALNLLHLGIQKPQDIRARGHAAVPERQHLLDLLQRDAQRFRVPDELKPLHILVAVLPVSRWRAARGGQDADLFVVADRLGVDAGPSGQLADQHGLLLRPSP